MSPTEAPADARARTYHRRQLALSASYLIVLVETRAAVHLAERLATWTPRWWLALAVAVLGLGGGYRLLSLPLAWLGRFLPPRRYGLLPQSLGRWLCDAAKTALVVGALRLVAGEAR